MVMGCFKHLRFLITENSIDIFCVCLSKNLDANNVHRRIYVAFRPLRHKLRIVDIQFLSSNSTKVESFN